MIIFVLISTQLLERFWFPAGCLVSGFIDDGVCSSFAADRMLDHALV